MIALGLLAQDSELRRKILGKNSPGATLGNVRVVGFTGRQSDAPLGIWGSIAEQLGKKEVFNNYYSPLQSPGVLEPAQIDYRNTEIFIEIESHSPYDPLGKRR